MKDAEFEALKVASIVPQKEQRWPSPNIEVSIMGDVSTVSGSLYWSALHAAVDDARTHFANALASMAAIDGDKQLSAVGRASKKAEIATAAIAALEKSRLLDKARTSVERQVAKWDKELGLTPGAAGCDQRRNDPCRDQSTPRLAQANGADDLF